MRRLGMIGLLSVMLLCSACAKQTKQAELTSITFWRGHGSTWGSQFRMDICPDQITYLHQFRGGQLHEFYDVPLEEETWTQIHTALQELMPQLQERKTTLLQRLKQALGPKEVDGGDWWSLTLTWQTDDDTKEVNYIWPDSEEAAAFERLLEEIALSVK